MIKTSGHSESWMRKCVRILYTHEFTRGWALGSHSGLLSAAAVDSSGRFFSFLGDSASRDVEAVLLFLPLTGDWSSSSSSTSPEEEQDRSLRILSPKCRGDGGRFGSS